MGSYFDQHEFDVRCEWGLAGMAHLLPVSDVIVIVDVLSFTTCVDIAVANGALVYPFDGRGDAAAAYAAELDAHLARHRQVPGSWYSLSPASLLDIPPGTRLVLPSPNGAALSLASGPLPTLSGCLRNAQAVALRAQSLGRRISVIAAGERWTDGSLRPGLEDLLGAGAVIDHLTGRRSPEAAAAWAAYRELKDNLVENLAQCSSGKELAGRGYSQDVALAAALNDSQFAPILVAGAYQS